jgi:hypothetical protein
MRAGATIVFKEGISADEAAKILALISDHIDLPDPNDKWMAKVAPRRVGQSAERILVEEFNPDHGWPVFYVP